jgi:4-diphosphocytidyl-2-C-methyl-D-erythritol kinase
MAGLGERLGSDVPFFFYAPTARVWGRGELVASLPMRGTRWLVLVNPGFPIETRGAYERLAASRTGPRPLSAIMAGLAERGESSWEEIVPLMENDFEPALTPAYPALDQIKRELLAAGAQAALLSGSGATVFGVFADEAGARRAASALAAPGRRVEAAPAGGA